MNKQVSNFLIKFISIVLIYIASANYLLADTYSYNGNPYTTAVAPYTTAMNVSVTLQTSSPIPANSTFYNITNILTSWSISDGVQTISNSNGVISPNYPPVFSTDSNGEITNFLSL